MSSRPYKCGVVLVGVLAALGSIGLPVSSLSAASARSKKEAKLPIIESIVSDRSVSTMRQKVEARKLAKTESGKSVAVESQGQTPPDRTSRKTRRHQKATVKIRLPAIVQPKPNLSCHGILQQPQRYDPSRDRRTGRVRNPLAGELLHEHFQELDKNYDGMIDPFERALGRLDLDHDLNNRQWE
jgi:hypothetical protein